LSSGAHRHPTDSPHERHPERDATAASKLNPAKMTLPEQPGDRS
jgi:hypothetical protein